MFICSYDVGLCSDLAVQFFFFYCFKINPMGIGFKIRDKSSHCNITESFSETNRLFYLDECPS